MPEQECCVTTTGLACAQKGSCPPIGAPAELACVDDCQCPVGRSCANDGFRCPTKVCGGCYASR